MSISDQLDKLNILPPTPKQIAFARSLASRNKVVLPWEIQQDRRVLSQWIETQAAVKVTNAHDVPSSKQVAFAERIARAKRQAVPDECFRSRDLMSRWIKSNQF